MGSDQKQGSERRQFLRIKKNYIIRFYEKLNPSLKFEVTQIENISKGGLCFNSTMSFEPGTALAIELRTPYVADTLFLEGKILDCRERIKGMIYENRLRFNDVAKEAEEVLVKIEKYNSHHADGR